MSIVASQPLVLAPPPLMRNTYLTDGVRLFRVEGTIDDPWRDGWALLEDCATLDGSFYTAQQLAAMHLEIVNPAGDG